MDPKIEIIKQMIAVARNQPNVSEKDRLLLDDTVEALDEINAEAQPSMERMAKIMEDLQAKLEERQKQ